MKNNKGEEGGKEGGGVFILFPCILGAYKREELNRGFTVQ